MSLYIYHIYTQALVLMVGSEPVLKMIFTFGLYLVLPALLFLKMIT